MKALYATRKYQNIPFCYYTVERQNYPISESTIAKVVTNLHHEEEENILEKPQKPGILRNHTLSLPARESIGPEYEPVTVTSRHKDPRKIRTAHQTLNILRETGPSPRERSRKTRKNSGTEKYRHVGTS